MKRIPVLLAAAMAISIGASACSSDSDGSAETATTPASSASTETSTGASTGTSSESTTGASDAGDAAAFPVTITHKFGETTIDEEPLKVVSIGFAEHDQLLSIGVIPIAVREWYGEFPYATWPWAQDELGDAQPEVLPSEALNFEQIAALQPDIIMGIGSGMTDTDYATLSAIAPTIAQPEDYIEYGTPWDVALEIAGRALGRSDEAATVIADTNQMFADAIAEHPEFAGATSAVTFYYEDAPGAYASEDTRSRTLTKLGFVIPEAIDEAAGDAFFVSISPEDLSLIDTDVVVWIVSDDVSTQGIVDLPTRATTRAFFEGREIFADPLLSGAFSHASPLSFEYVIDTLVPELALAVDGDPATVVPSAVAAGATG